MIYQCCLASVLAVVVILLLASTASAFTVGKPSTCETTMAQFLQPNQDPSVSSRRSWFTESLTAAAAGGGLLLLGGGTIEPANASGGATAGRYT